MTADRLSAEARNRHVHLTGDLSRVLTLDDARHLLETLSAAVEEASTRRLLTLEQSHMVLDLLGEHVDCLYGTKRNALLALRVPICEDEL